MRPVSRIFLALSALIVGGASYVLWADESQHAAKPPFTLSIDHAPIDRSGRMPISFSPVVKRAEPSVVYISSTKRVRAPDISQFFQDPMFRHFFGPFAPGGRGGTGPRYQTEESLGSGVIVSPNGYILTNNHVVEGADEVTVKFANNQKQYKAKVIGRDSEADVAVLKIDATGLPAAVLGDSDELQVGDTVLAVGDPFGIGLTVTHGIVSALGRNDVGIESYEDFIQTDAAINPGNSGGPLMDVEGRVVGLNTAIVSQGGGSNGIGFAIPINLVRALADQLIRTGKVERGFLGVELQELTPDLSEEFGSTSGALVTDVEAGTPADKAGLKSGDVITELNGKPVQDFRQLRLAISEMTPGTVVHLQVLRGTKTQTIDVTLGERPSGNLAGGENGNTPANDTGVLNGVSVGDITPDLRDQLQIPENLHGAVITDVSPDSASAHDGLQKGDIILDLDHRPVHNADEAVRLSEEIKGPKVLVRIWRSGTTLYVVVDESQSGSGSGNSGPASPNGDGGDQDNGPQMPGQQGGPLNPE